MTATREDGRSAEQMRPMCTRPGPRVADPIP